MRLTFDITTFFRNQLPVKKRQTNRLKLYQWVFSQLVTMFYSFYAWRFEMIYESNITGQKLALENFLNRRVTNSQNQIYIDEVTSVGIWLSLQVEGTDYMWLSTSTEDTNRMFIGLESEEQINSNVNFIVYVQNGVDSGEVDKYIKRYVIAGMNYKIANI